MRTEIDIVCDRCGKTVHGIIIEEPGVPKITGGYYDVTPPSAWGMFSLPDEQAVCDQCMWSNLEFQKMYPVEKKIPNGPDVFPVQRPPDEIERIKAERRKERGKSGRERMLVENENLGVKKPEKPEKPEKPDKKK